MMNTDRDCMQNILFLHMGDIRKIDVALGERTIACHDRHDIFR